MAAGQKPGVGELVKMKRNCPTVVLKGVLFDPWPGEKKMFTQNLFWNQGV